MSIRENGGHALITGNNYGQGSSREHAALAPRYLGLRVVVAKGFPRIHLVNFGVLPLAFTNESDYDMLEKGDVLRFSGLRSQIKRGNVLTAKVNVKDRTFEVSHALSGRQIDIMLKGGLINWVRERQENQNLVKV